VNGLAPVAGTVMALTFLTGSVALAPGASTTASPRTAGAVGEAGATGAVGEVGARGTVSRAEGGAASVNGTSRATRASRTAARPASQVRALFLLSRAAKAAEVTSYSGVQFVSRWSSGGTTSVIVDVRHLPGEGMLMRVRGAGTKPGGDVFAASEAADGLSSSGGGSIGLLARNYAVVGAGSTRVAGRPAHLVEARRWDGSLAAQFWLDDETGVMLRREVFDGRGATVRASAFIDFSPQQGSFVSHLPPALPAAWGTQVSSSGLAGLRSAGWACPEGLPPGLDLYDVRRADDATGPVVHSSYSDGLSTVSLFEQRGRLATSSLSGYHEERVGGATVYLRDDVQQSVTWSAHGMVYTVIADAPQDAVREVVAALPHERVKTGATARLRRGLGRVASWVNPFG
jgi:sigma-E factor negative regulatory protein RseB